MKDFIKKNKTILLTLCLSSILILFILIMNKITPFGNITLSLGDLNSQYENFLIELFHKIKSGSSLVYSFNNGLGYSFFGTIVSYLMSPATILYLLLHKFNINKIITLIIFVKPLLASLTMSYYLHKKFNSDKWYIPVLSILYAFCGFFNAYYLYVMWLDAFIMLPLLVLGLEDLINDNKTYLYMIGLFFTILSSYYQGFMICVFLLIYFIMYSRYKNKLNKEKCLLFIKSSLKVVLLSSFILVPMIFLLKDSGAALSSVSNSAYEFPYNPLEFIAALFTGSTATRFSTINRNITDIATNAPNITVGLLPILLFINYIFNKNINLKNKKLYISLLVILILFLSIPMLDTLMHGLHSPNDMPFRYSYMFSFILLVISMYELEFTSNKEYKMTILLTSILVALLLVFRPLNLDIKMLLLDIVILAIYIGLIIWYKKNIKIKPLLIIMIIMLSFIECYINFSRNVYKADISINNYNLIETNIKYIKMKEEDLFYRIGTKSDSNLGSRFDNKNISFFNSVNNKRVGNLMTKMGIENYRVSYFNYNGATPVFNLLFNIKYNVCTNDEYYDEVIKNINKYRYNKGPMFLVSKDVLEWNYNSDNPFEVHNDIVSKISKENDLFTSVKLNKVEKLRRNHYTYEFNTDKEYIYLYLGGVKFFEYDNKLYYADIFEGESSKVRTLAKNLNVKFDKEERISGGRIIKLDVKDSKSLNVYFKDDNERNLLIYEMDNNKFEKFADSITNTVEIDKVTDDSILGTVRVEEDNSLVFTSIEYNTGWKLYVDAKEADITVIGDSLVGVKLNKGLHTIYLKYEVPYYREGMIITLITIIMLSLYEVMDVMADKEDKNIDNNIEKNI